MYLKKLHISNFRCFRDYTIEFAPGVTVLFGKNGSGKSTLIHAIHKALSFAFNRSKDSEAINLGAGFSSLKPRDYDKSEDLVRDPKTGRAFPFIDIHATAQFHNAVLDWRIYASTSTFKAQPSKYAEAFNKLSAEIQATDTLPLFAYFSDSFPHMSGNNTKLTEMEMSLRNLGYLGWDEETAYSDLWITRLTKIWTLWDRANRNIQHEETTLRNCTYLKVHGIVTDQEYNEDVAMHTARLEAAKREKTRYDNEVNAIRKCLVKFSEKLPGIDIINIFVSVYEEVGLCLETKDGHNPPLEKLPAGYKRVIYMALDIAYRSFILNGSTNKSGIVVIDEIDLHLHPELEQAILQCFYETFTNIQFVVTTHSPLVLTGIETENTDNRIFKMTNDFEMPVAWHNIYGVDYNQALVEDMGVRKRSPKIDNLFEKAWDEVAKKDVEAAKKTVAELETKKTPADQIELVKLRAIINRIEIIGK